MGPLRRGLITLAAALATPSLAAANCAQVRPNWTPGTDATAWGEMVALLSTPPSLGLIVLTALAVRFRHQWAALVVVVLWSVWVSLVAMSAPNETMQAALIEGCVGSATLFIALVAAICGATIVYTSPRKPRSD